MTMALAGFRTTTVRLIAAAMLLGTLAVYAAENVPSGWFGAGLVLRHGPDNEAFLHAQRVLAGAPAEKAGLRPLDVIYRIDGKAVAFRNEVEFFNYCRTLKPGQKVRWDVMRGSERRTITVTVDPFPEKYHAAWLAQYEIAKRTQQR